MFILDQAGSVLFASFLVLTLALLAGTGTAAAAQSAPNCSTVTYEGDGTDANPYEVSNVDQLQCIQNQGLDASYELVSDIDAAGTSAWNNGKGFDPIGEFNESKSVVTAEFNGNFDGNDYHITGLTIDRDGGDPVGLFSVIGSSGMVTNLGIVDANINGSHGVGGLAGVNVGTGTIEKSYATGLINGSRFVGGLVGDNPLNGGTIEKSCATASVSGSFQVGGLIGRNTGTVDKSCVSGSVNGDESVGGFVGFNLGTIKRSYATGEVDGSKEVGGLVGDNVDTVSNSYATGSVNGSFQVGGLIGVNAGTANESYWDTQTTGRSSPASSSAGGTGLNTSEMTGEAARGNMTGFDFTNTWVTVTNPDDYPILAWQTGSSGDASGDASGDGNDNTTNSGNERDENETSNDGGEGGGDGSDDSQGNNPPTDEGTESGTEGLPGFTGVTAVLALLTVVAAFIRRKKS